MISANSQNWQGWFPLKVFCTASTIDPVLPHWLGNIVSHPVSWTTDEPNPQPNAAATSRTTRKQRPAW